MTAREVDEEDNFCSREVSIVAELFSFDKACINVSHSTTSDSGLFSSAICSRISSTSFLTRAILCSSVSSCDSISCLEVRYDCFRFLAVNVSEKSRQYTDTAGQVPAYSASTRSSANLLRAASIEKPCFSMFSSSSSESEVYEFRNALSEEYRDCGRVVWDIRSFVDVLLVYFLNKLAYKGQ